MLAVTVPPVAWEYSQEISESKFQDLLYRHYRDLYPGSAPKIIDDYISWICNIILANYKSATTPRNRFLVRQKAAHIIDTVLSARQIQSQIDPSVGISQLQADILLLSHDIGRFPQSQTGTFSDTKSNQDHASIGADMINKAGWDFTEFGVSHSELNEAVYHHNKITYLGDSNFTKFTRDADKLALLWRWERLNNEFNLVHMPAGPISDEVWGDICNQTPVKLQSVKTAADQLLLTLAFLYDFNFSATKHLVYESDIVDQIIAYIKPLDPARNFTQLHQTLKSKL